MAESILYNIAATTLQSLGTATIGRDIGFLFGTSDELRKLESTMSMIKAVILDAEVKQDKNNQVKDWIQKLEDAFYVADDLVDCFATEKLWRRVMFGDRSVSVFFSRSNQMAFALKFGPRVKQVRERFDEIAEDSKRFGLITRSYDETRVRSRSRESHSFVRDTDVFGRENDKAAILRLLLEGSEEDVVSVVAIVGIGGLGKTTLAQQVFNDEGVIKGFGSRVWVSVSEVFDSRSLMERIVQSMTGESPGGLNLDQLQSRVRGAVTGKRFLLVLDDLWVEDREKWLSIETLLRDGERGSRVMLTTRSEMVAKVTAAQTRFWYKLKGLDRASSWTLFESVAFEKGEVKRLRFEKMGTQILEKCSGVPLAIKSIGTMLFAKSEDEWRFITENELANVPPGEKNIFPTLKISYNYLPSYLKRCFAYCRLFPNDRELDVQQLIRLWIAQGFVVPSSISSQCLEDVGYKYFTDLLHGSFFQEPVFDDWGVVKRCKIHRLMHDLAAVVAGPGSIKIDQNMENFGEKTLHLSFDFKFNESGKIPPMLLKKNSTLRTFISPKQSTWDVLQFSGSLESTSKFSGGLESQSQCLNRDALFLNFVSLRTLDLKALNIKELPCNLGELRHLRYLDVSQNKFKVLPSSIKRLQNLQALILLNCQELIRLPWNMKKLISLRYLQLHGCRSLTFMPHGLRELTSLYSLDRFVVANVSNASKYSELCELGSLSGLRGSLSIENLEHKKGSASEFKLANLKDKKHLQSLVLHWKSEFQNYQSHDDETSLENLQPHSNLKALKVVNYMGSKFAAWLSSLENLVKLELLSCEKCSYLPPLDELPCLKELTLSLTALEYVTDQSLTSLSTPTKPFFPSLRTLKIQFCVNLKGWSRSIESIGSTTATTLVFPCLRDLEIRNCPRFTSMPLFPSLTNLELMNTSYKPLQQTMTTMINENSSAPLTELKNLSISKIKDVEYFPEEIGNLASLKSLGIVECTILASLPEAMRRLSGLQSLKIVNCPMLSQRCAKDMGEDWHKICHIPRIETD